MSYKKILLRRDTSSNWSSSNPTLSAGELGYETNTQKLKIGDGSSAWNSLGYWVGSLLGGTLNDIGDVTIVAAADGDFLRWNGTAWINDAVNLSTDTTGSFVQSLVAGTGVTLSGNSGENATPTVNVDTTVIQARVTNVTDTEIGYLDGVTSAIQTQIDAKAPLASPTFTGTVVLPDNTVALGTKTTGDYVASLVAGTGVALTNNSGETATPTIAIGQAVATNSNVTFNDLTVSGNFTVSGTTTSINTETLTIDDNIIVLNNNVTATPTENAGIEIERGTSANVALRWNETSDKWEITTDGSTYADIATETYADSLTPATLDAIGNVTITSATSGQFLKWNGSAWVNDSIPTINTLDDVGDVTITSATSGDFLKWNGTAWVNDPIDLGTDTVGNYMTDVSAGDGITVTHTAGEGSTATISARDVLVRFYMEVM